MHLLFLLGSIRFELQKLVGHQCKKKGERNCKVQSQVTFKKNSKVILLMW